MVSFHGFLCHLAIAHSISSDFHHGFFCRLSNVFRAVGEGHAAPAQPLVGRGARGRRHEDGRAQGLGVDVLVASPCVDDIKFYKIMYNIYIYISYMY